MAEFLCGRRGAMDEADLTKAERKAVRNFKQYLRGEGERCPICLHKAEKHSYACEARGCECMLMWDGVLKAREKAKALGWEKDKNR